MRPSSSSTTEPRIAGFRIVREVATDATSTTYDAVQEDLDRPVTLVVLGSGDPRAARFRADAWPDHPHVVSLYAAGRTEAGLFIATRRVPGATTLRRRVSAGADPAPWIAEVRRTLAATGAVHGALDDEASLLVDRDGNVLITRFGLAAPGASAADDERALAALEQLPGRPGRRGWRRPAAGAAVALAGTVAAVTALGGAGDGAADRPPVVRAGALPLGSALAPGPVTTADCDGEAPSGSSLSCTAMQAALPGRALVAPHDGTVVAWHVRGARGDVALRVIRRDGAAGFARVGGSAFAAADGGVQTFGAALAVRRGDRFALELAPGAAAGFRAAVRGAATTRFTDALKEVPRAPNPRPGLGRDEELLLRVDVVPGRAPRQPARLTGAAAAAAPRGRRLEERELDVAGGATVTAAVVALRDGLAVDVVAGGRRRARIAVPGARPGGQVEAFTAKGAPDVTLRWRNRDGTRVAIAYRITARSIAELR